jgi:hypothetical protein
LTHFVFPEPVVGLHVSLSNLVTQRAAPPHSTSTKNFLPAICHAVPFNNISEVKSRKLLVHLRAINVMYWMYNRLNGTQLFIHTQLATLALFLECFISEIVAAVPINHFKKKAPAVQINQPFYTQVFTLHSMIITIVISNENYVLSKITFIIY